MIFPTIDFAAFFVVVMFASWLLMPNPRLWKPFMVAVSLFFYGYANWRLVALIVFSIVINQLAATVITRTPRRRFRKTVLITAIATNLGLLGVFKYFGFFTDSVNEALRTIGLGMPVPMLAIALPIGISFFTFQAISYVVDVYHDDFKLAKPWDYAVYASFFPHLVAGPIVRAREFIPQLAKPRSPRNLPITAALFLIAGGLIKKILLADLLATRLVDPVFNSPGNHSAIDTFVAILGYTAQIYCDFSAYTDIAIGLAMLLGFRFPQNFNRPYAAIGLQDFWRRWHMTLSRWLRDYLYIPLGGSRKGPRRTYINLMLTMLLGGLWHGAAWTFVLWGGIHGTGLSFERWATKRRADRGYGNPSKVDLRNSRDEPPKPRPEVETSGGVTRSQPAASGAIRLEVLDRLGTARVEAQKLTTTRLTEIADAIVLRPWPRWVLLLATFATVSLAWVFFRADSVSDAFAVFWQLIAGWAEPTTLVTPTVLVVLVVALGSQFVPRKSWQLMEARVSRLPWIAQGIGFGAFLVVMNAMIGQQGVAPFIYFAF